MQTSYLGLGTKSTKLVHTAPKGLISVYRDQNGLYFLVLDLPTSSSRAIIAESLINRKAAIALANDKEYLY